MRQRQHWPRSVLLDARADLEPYRPDAQLGTRRRQHAVLGPRELPVHLRLRHMAVTLAVAVVVTLLLVVAVGLAVAVAVLSGGAVAVPLVRRHEEMSSSGRDEWCFV